MLDPRLLLGYPIPFKNICTIYPPTVKDIVGDFRTIFYRKIFTLSQEDIEDEFNEEHLDLANILTPLEYALNNAYNNPKIRLLVQQGFEFFIHEKVTLLYDQKAIVIGDLKDELISAKDVQQLRMIKEEDYFEFQNQIRQCLGEKPVSPPDPNEHPKVRAMKAKARYRDRVKAKKGGGLNLTTTLLSICCMNSGINLLNIGELSYAALSPLIRQYQEKEKYNIDIRSLLAGADSKKVNPKYWIRNIED